jgi:hypothetical protein
MKKMIAFALMFAAQNYLTVSASADPIITKDVVISVNDVFVPEKVERGADAKVVVSGMFPNSCYRWSRVEVADTSPTEHKLQAHALVTQTMCLMVLVPYSKEVNLGKLQAGTHTLRFINGDETFFERSLVVE